MRTKKWMVPFFSFYDTAGMEHYLENQALNGWLLEEITNFRWIFRRCAPHTVHYTVTYYPPASAFEPEPSEGQQTFEDFCAHAGWRLAASNAQLMIFANEQEDPVPIHTDPIPAIESMEKIARKTLWAWVLLFFLMGGNLWSELFGIFGLFRDPIRFLSDSFHILEIPTYALLLFSFLLEFVGWFRWHKKALAAAERGEFLSGQSRLCWHSRLLWAALLSFALQMLCALLDSRDPTTQITMLFMLLGYGALFYTVNAVRLALKKKKVSAGTNLAITLIVDIAMVLVMTFGIFFCITRFDFHAEPAEGELALTLEALTGEEYPEYIQDVDASVSFLLSSADYVQRMPFDRDSRGSLWLEYHQIDVFWAPLYDLCLRQLLHQYDDWGDHEPDYDPAHPYYVFEAMDAAPWGADQAYQLRSYGTAADTYLLCWDSRMVVLDTDWLLDEAQMAIAGAALAPGPTSP